MLFIITTSIIIIIIIKWMQKYEVQVKKERIIDEKENQMICRMRQRTFCECLYLKVQDPPGQALSVLAQRGPSKYSKLPIRSHWEIPFVFFPEPPSFNQNCLTDITAQNWSWVLVQTTINVDIQKLASHSVIQGPRRWHLGPGHLLETLNPLLYLQNPYIRQKKEKNKAPRRFLWA